MAREHIDHPSYKTIHKPNTTPGFTRCGIRIRPGSKKVAKAGTMKPVCKTCLSFRYRRRLRLLKISA